MDNYKVLYIEGDGVGKEITPCMIETVNAALVKAYGSNVSIDWEEIYLGQKAEALCNTALPQESLDKIKQHKIAIKGPLGTPVAKGARSLNVALRQELDLFVCLRPIKYFKGTPTPVKKPENVSMVVFRENTEDIYAGIEYMAGSEEVKKLISILEKEFNVNKIRFPETSSIGIKPVSSQGSKRLVKAAIEYAIENKLPSVTLVHKGNIMKYTEGGFLLWGREVAAEYGAQMIDGKLMIKEHNIEIKDCICDAFLQNILLKPEEYSVVATLNLNGDYVSDALAAQVGGIGISPGANINYDTGVAVFEATHGIAPDIAGQNIVNPLSLILSGVMMLEYMNLNEAAALITKAVENTIANKTVTKDFHRLMPDSTLLSTTEFTNCLIAEINK